MDGNIFNSGTKYLSGVSMYRGDGGGAGEHIASLQTLLFKVCT